MAAVKNKQEDKDSDDNKEIIEERDENGKPSYGPSFEKYLDCDNPMDLSLQHNEWMPSYADNFTRKVESDGAWNLKCRKCSIVDPYGNEYNHGYQTKATDMELSKFYKLSDIMSPDWF
ncbi:hypothetical protein Tco_0291861 [Tanacetum coccineum]